MKETIKQSVIRLEKFKPQLKKEVLESFKHYKKSRKGLKETKERGFKITNKGLIPYTYISTIEDKKRSFGLSSLFKMFKADRYSNKEYIIRNKKVLIGLFKEDKEVLRIVKYSFNKLKEVLK